MSDRVIDRRVRHAMRILENEQTPLPETAAVAARVGLSRSYFVRLFTAQVGLSPQDYGRGLIMRHAAGRIRYCNDPIATVAHDFGYARQATFNKAFTRYHGMPPARWRALAQRTIAAVSGEGVRLRRMPAQRCFARRYLGPRSLTGLQWADFIRRLPPDLAARPRLGFTYDDPSLTPPERVRHDCAVLIEGDAILPDALAEDGFERLETPAGLWAVCEVAGTDAGPGYRSILDGWLPRHAGYALEGDPHLERYAAKPEGGIGLSVWLRVRPTGDAGNWNMAVVAPDAAKA